ncbi:MAG: hypothetical protein EBS38_01355 [Actinobacteria bacterium]|nr:hypothetical protein [Actinomycetota bacterium]
MAFPNNGVVEAPQIVPSAFGLLAVVKPENSAEEDRWIRGFSQEWETEVSNLVNWDDTDTTVDVYAERVNPVRHVKIKPFFIEATEDISTFGFLGLDRIARITRQIEAGSQKAIERELWDGVVRKGESHENAALSSATVTILGGGTAYSAKRALALLEQGIAEASQFGEQGLIHMTRDVAALLSSNSQMLFHNKVKDHLQTMGGTPVVVGNGYSGNGPDGDTHAEASATNKWMYATGTVRVYLGDVDVVNDNLAQGYDVSGNANDMRLKAIRPAAVYFDTSIHLAVRVDLTA